MKGFETDWIVNSCWYADVERLAVDRHHRDPEPFRVGLGQLGNIVGHFAFVVALVLVVNFIARTARSGETVDRSPSQQGVELAASMFVSHGVQGVGVSSSSPRRYPRSSDLAVCDLFNRRERMIGKAEGENAAAGVLHDLGVERQVGRGFDLEWFFDLARTMVAMPGGTLFTNISISLTSNLRANSTVTAVP